MHLGDLVEHDLGAEYSVLPGAVRQRSREVRAVVRNSLQRRISGRPRRSYVVADAEAGWLQAVQEVARMRRAAGVCGRLEVLLRMARQPRLAEQAAQERRAAALCGADQISMKRGDSESLLSQLTLCDLSGGGHDLLGLESEAQPLAPGRLVGGETRDFVHS
jgi:hypothetical protein